MTDAAFKENVFDKINDTYKLLKPLKDLKPFGNDKEWAEWFNNCENYCDSIQDPKLKSTLNRFLIDMGDYISSLNK